MFDLSGEPIADIWNQIDTEKNWNKTFCNLERFTWYLTMDPKLIILTKAAVFHYKRVTPSARLLYTTSLSHALPPTLSISPFHFSKLTLARPVTRRHIACNPSLVNGVYEEYTTTLKHIYIDNQFFTIRILMWPFAWALFHDFLRYLANEARAILLTKFSTNVLIGCKVMCTFNCVIAPETSIVQRWVGIIKGMNDEIEIMDVKTL